MKIVQNEAGRFSKDGVNYRIKREEGDTQHKRQYAKENGYTVRGHDEIQLSIAKVAKRRAIAKARYNQEMSGFQLPPEQGGMFVRTDPRNRTLLVSAALRATSDPLYEVPNWKTASGTFITLTNEMLLLLDSEVHSFIAGCFAKEVQLSAAIDAATTLEELEEIKW